MKRALTILAISALVLLLATVRTVYAGSATSMGVSTTDSDIFPDLYASRLWSAFSSCPDKYSVRHYTGQFANDYNNFPNKLCNTMYSSYWNYSSFVPPATYSIRWYNETGFVYNPAYYRLTTYVSN